MPFPLPLDSHFRKEVISSWIDDIDDRLLRGDFEGANESWRIANTLYISLPPGQGDVFLEELLVQGRVKLNQHRYHKPCEQ